MYRFKAIVM